MHRFSPFVLLLTACAHRSEIARPDNRSADLAVYRAVFDSMFVRHAPSGITQIVVRDSTSVFTRRSSISEVFEGFYRLPDVDTAAVRDFEARSSEPHSLKVLNRLGLRIPITLVGIQALKSLFSETPTDSTRHQDPDLYWKQFYRTYPGSPGEISLSAIGYSANGELAILMVDQSCGSLCGDGYMISVRRTGGEWRIASIQRTWVS